MPLINIDDPVLDKHSLYAEMLGTGSPTIVIKVGGTMPGTLDPGWKPIRDALSQEATVFTYDRANLGKSDSVPRPRTLDNFTNDLHAVLLASQVKLPFLLVGGSLGGMIVTYYASLFPQHICGILPVDPPHPEVNLHTLEILPVKMTDEPESLAAFRKIALQEQFAPLEITESESLDFLISIFQAKASWKLHDIPLVVLTAGINKWEKNFYRELLRKMKSIGWIYRKNMLLCRRNQPTS